VCDQSSAAVTAPISASEALTAKLQEVKGSLQARLTQDFEHLMGVKLPASSAAALFTEEYDLISTETSVESVVTGYDAAAAALFPVRITSAILQRAALAVAISLLRYVQGQGKINAGGYACSERTMIDSRQWISAAFCEVQHCSGAAWSTPVDFNIIYFAFVVWAPTTVSERALNATAGTFGNNRVLHWSLDLPATVAHGPGRQCLIRRGPKPAAAPDETSQPSARRRPAALQPAAVTQTATEPGCTLIRSFRVAGRAPPSSSKGVLRSNLPPRFFPECATTATSATAVVLPGRVADWGDAQTFRQRASHSP